LGSIVQIQLARVAQRLESRGITLNLTDKASQHILNEAYDPHYGARPLKRWLEKYIVTDLSKMLISGKLMDRSKVTIDYKGGGDKLSYKIEHDPNATVGADVPMADSDSDQDEGMDVEEMD
jgi:ATP-dependent Clp protease ATP-binding subunit ClpB